MVIARISRTAAQALELLKKMHVDVEQAMETGEMYKFKYRDTLMFIKADTDDNKLHVSAPVILEGNSDKQNKEIYDIAMELTSEVLKDYNILYVKESFSIVVQIYERPKCSRALRLFQFYRLLDRIKSAQNLFMESASFVAKELNGMDADRKETTDK